MADVFGNQFPTGRVKIFGFQGSVVAKCSCGHDEPLLIPFIPGAIGQGAECGRCQTIWSVREMHYTSIDEHGNMKPNVKIELNKQIPTIARPGGMARV